MTFFCLTGGYFGLSQEADWKLRKDKDGIKVYTRNTPNSDLDEFRGEMTLPYSFEKIFSVLKDAEAYKKWSPGVIESEHVATDGEYHYQYSENDAPFPISNRDSYARFKYKKSENQIKIEFEAVPDYGPRKEGKVRVTKADGFWLIEKLNEHESKVTYQVLAEPGGSIPAWLANSAAVDTPFDALSGLREYLEK